VLVHFLHVGLQTFFKTQPQTCWRFLPQRHSMQ
jgi:hypothetical protein